MSHLLRIALIILLAGLVACGGSRLRKGYDKLAPGMSSEEVLALVGPPSVKRRENTAWSYIRDGKPVFTLLMSSNIDPAKQELVSVGQYLDGD